MAAISITPVHIAAGQVITNTGAKTIVYDLDSNVGPSKNRGVIKPGGVFTPHEAVWIVAPFGDSTYSITSDSTVPSPKGLMASGMSRNRPQYLQQRNDWPNPLASGANPVNFAASFGAGATATSSGGVNDTDLGSSMSSKATYPGDFSAHTVEFGRTFANAVLKSIRPYQDFNHVVHYIRAKVKVVSGPNTPMDLKLHSISQDGAGGNLRDVAIDYRSGVNVGDIFAMEGFDVTTSAQDHIGGYMEVVAAGTSGASTVELRVTEVQIVIDPIAEPHFGHGARNRWTWRGAANASGSDGWAAREPLPNDFPGGWGFQGTTQYDRQIDTDAIGPEQEVLLLASVGVTAHRGDLAAATTTGGSAWPQGTPAPDWRSSAMKWYADYMDAMRHHGLKACPIFGAPLGWMTTDHAADTAYSLRTLDPAHYDDFAKLYIAILDEWPDVVTAVELFNEPNFTSVWGATPDPALFSQHMIPFVKAIRDKHPNVKVVGTALATITDGIPAGSGMGAQTFLQGLYDHGLAQILDAISIHPYSFTPASGFDPSAGPGQQLNFNAYINEILKVMRANGDATKKLWITENGGNYVNGGNWTHRNVAIYNMLCRAIAARRPEIEAYFSHSIVDTYQQVAGSRGYGTIDIDKGYPRLNYYAQADAKLPEADWINIPMTNGWVPLDANSVGAQYRIEPNGDVRVRGQIKGGSSATAGIGTIPFKMPLPRVGWFPAMALVVSTWGFAMIQVNADGTFFFNQGGSATGMIFDFSFTPGAQ